MACRANVNPLANRLAIISRPDEQSGMISLCTKRATAHLICYLVCQFACQRSPAGDSCFLPLAIPRHKLASRLGMTESHLSRTFRDLEAKALLIPRGRGYDVPSIAALSNHVCPGGCDF